MKAIMLVVSFLLSFCVFAESKITLFVTLSPAGSFQAVSKKPKGNLFKNGEEFTADKISISIESFKTGIELRDEHTWKHLNSSKHPKAILTALKAKAGKAEAVLEVNGVKKPITISYKEQGQEILAKFSVKNSDFKLEKASYLGVGVDDLIQVEAIIPFRVK